MTPSRQLKISVSSEPRKIHHSRQPSQTCNLPTFRKHAPIIEHAPSPGTPSRNPYRTILRRDYPEPFIALLAFILGIWLWDHYFGQNLGYSPGTETMALVKADRDLRLADAMAEDPAWLRWLAGTDTPVIARENTLTVFQKLAIDQSLSLQGLEAFAVLKSQHENLPLQHLMLQATGGRMNFDFDLASHELANHRGTWWSARIVADMEQEMSPATQWRQTYTDDSHTLRNRAIFVRSSVWALCLAGLFFLPTCLHTLGDGLRAKPQGYSSGWPLSLGLVVFLCATLAWIGFTLLLEIGIGSLPYLHPAIGIFLDSAARMLPPLIALGLLFRRPSHAIQALGITKPIPVRAIIGLFSILIILDQGLRLVFENSAATDPGGGLSPSEAGIWGLAFAIISACILAPLAEEILYRGVLFKSFWNRLGVLPAAILSAIVFAALHFYDGYGLSSVGIFGFSCAILYAATGSLSATIALHMLYNFSIKFPEWLVYHCPLG